jgi:RimJ/RimL family protein N-acetyltransferase
MPVTRTIGFRPLSHSDAAFAAEADGAIDPRHRQSREELLDRWVNTEKGADVKRFAVQVDGVDFGWTSLVKPHDSAGDAVWLNLIVPGDDEVVLDAALAFAETEARELHPAMLLSHVWDSQAATILVLERQGYEKKRGQRFWRLELAPNAAQLVELRAIVRTKVASHGIRLASAAELGGESIYPALYAINDAASRDIPSTVPYTPETYATWLGWMQSPWIFMDRIWVAVAEGEPVGYSYLAYRPSLAQTGFTGVLREHRNKGLAKALKLETLVQAVDLGVNAVETDNDYENAPILHLNEELGYREVASQFEFHKPV